MQRLTFLEFFAGGGMCRAGLGPGWDCLFANDFDPKKAQAYSANWGGGEIRVGDIHALTASEIPGHADLAWASFPCQDLSLAGNGAGLEGLRSGAFHGFARIIRELGAEQRAPKILVLENVVGAITSNGGRDFTALCGALASLNYCFGAMVIDASHFAPQSRPRLFVVARKGAKNSASPFCAPSPTPGFAPAALVRAFAQLPPQLQERWRWWSLPPLPVSNAALIDVIEDKPGDVVWQTRAQTQRLLSMMSEVNRAKLRDAQNSGCVCIGALYRRTRRTPEGERVQRAEVRFDGLAGCLRTPGGGSSRQFIMRVEGASVRTRLLSGREAARLMGLRDDYVLPARYNDALHLLGDGVAAPVVRFLAENLLEPLCAGDGRKRLAAAE